MPLDQATLQRQLDRANEELALWVKALGNNGTAKAARRKDTRWRQLNAACNAIRRRMKAVSVVKSREEAAIQRKAEKLAAPAPEKEAKPKSAAKDKKPSKDKGAAKDKGPVKDKGAGKKGEKGAEAKEKKKKS